MADIDLPVWSVPPNWSTPVTERLEWLSNVHTSKSGAEQRTGVRETPRRFFEFRINPIGNVRSYVDLWLHNLGDGECLLPIWHDKAKLAADADDATTRLEFDTTFREYAAGDLAVIYKNAFTFEVVEIDAVDDDGLDLATALADPWPRGAAVYPLRKSYLDPEVSSDALTSRVGETQMLFQVNQDNDYDPGDELLTTYAGYPLIQLEPNRMDALTTQYARIMETLDERIGLIARYDSTGRAFPTQFYNWKAKGRQQHHELRQLLYRLRGRQKAVWLPSFNEDVTLARPLAALNNAINIQQIGYGLTGGVQPGRNRLLIRDTSGVNHVVQIAATALPLGPGEERLTLTAPAGFQALTGFSGSFLDTVRLDQDTVEITHHTDSDGVCEVSAAFKAFSDTRIVAGPFTLPTPVEEMNSVPCGAPEVDNPCAPPPFPGWDYELSMVIGCSSSAINAGLYFAAPDLIGEGGDAWHEQTFNGTTTTRKVFIRMGEDGGSMVGTWLFTFDSDYVNIFPSLVNCCVMNAYFRHWTQSSPTFFHKIPGTGPCYGGIFGLTELNVPYENSIDWRDYR